MREEEITLHLIMEVYRKAAREQALHRLSDAKNPRISGDPGGHYRKSEPGILRFAIADWNPPFPCCDLIHRSELFKLRAAPN